MKNLIKKEIIKYLNEEYVAGLTLYRGVTTENQKPDDNSYSFFAEHVDFAYDYGDYVYECRFKPMNLFISFKIKYIEELYNEGFKLRDFHIEDSWKNFVLDYDINKIYDYDEFYSINNGYKSAADFYNTVPNYIEKYCN